MICHSILLIAFGHVLLINLYIDFNAELIGYIEYCN